jgi:hypothetical protein
MIAWLMRMLFGAPEDFDRRVPYTPKHDWVISADPEALDPVCARCGRPCLFGTLYENCPGPEVQA